MSPDVFGEKRREEKLRSSIGVNVPFVSGEAWLRRVKSSALLTKTHLCRKQACTDASARHQVACQGSKEKLCLAQSAVCGPPRGPQ
jgi:hypothetical protein